jgi:hypothetical protein
MCEPYGIAYLEIRAMWLFHMAMKPAVFLHHWFPREKRTKNLDGFLGGPWLWNLVESSCFSTSSKHFQNIKLDGTALPKKLLVAPVAPTKFPHHKVNRVARLRRRTRSHWIQRVRWCARRLRCSSPRLAGQTTTAPEPSTRWGYHEKKTGYGIIVPAISWRYWYVSK